MRTFPHKPGGYDMSFRKNVSRRKVNVSAATPITRKPLRSKRNSSAERASVIQISEEDSVEALSLLLSKGQVQALPNESYVVGPEHIALLENAGIQYEIISE
jgi:hypothetical protein